MASEKQIAANRANAKRSTGPRSALGKLRSSRNAVRHGLSCPLPLDATSGEARAIAHSLVADGADDQQQLAASELAAAQLELLRIRAERGRLLASIDPASSDAVELKRLVALDRYERLAHTRRRRASDKLSLRVRSDFAK
jgi:hypothetical protein